MSLLKSAPRQADSPHEPDFPLPVLDPTIRQMHRECVVGGCSYRSRFLSGAGWVVAGFSLIVAALMSQYGAGSHEVLVKENALLSQQIVALREKLAERPAPTLPPAAEPALPEVAPPPPVPPPPPRRSATPAPKKPAEYVVPESEKWWNRP